MHVLYPSVVVAEGNNTAVQTLYRRLVVPNLNIWRRCHNVTAALATSLGSHNMLILLRCVWVQENILSNSYSQ